MSESHSVATFSSRLRENFRRNRVRWWTGGTVFLIALAVVVWLKRRGISFTVLRQWIAHPPAWFMPLGFAAVALLALVILWKVPHWQVKNVEGLLPKEKFDRVNEARKTLATILGGAAFLVGGFFTWQNIKVAQTSLEVSREGQITDRFSKAIEQLGAVDKDGKKTMEVRLGGIYALEGIANESKELHWPIMEVLCTYVRVNAPLKPEEPAQRNQPATTPARPAEIRPSADIQAVLTVLGRRDQKTEKVDQHLDLDETDIAGAYLPRTDLARTYLFRANLSGANITGAHLKWADLSGAYLVRAGLSGADLDGAHLNGSDLTGAELSGTNLSGADLYRAHLDGAHLRQTRGLTQMQVDNAMGDSRTQLPDNLHMPESWKKVPVKTARP